MSLWWCCPSGSEKEQGSQPSSTQSVESHPDTGLSLDPFREQRRAKLTLTSDTSRDAHSKIKVSLIIFDSSRKPTYTGQVAIRSNGQLEQDRAYIH